MVRQFLGSWSLIASCNPSTPAIVPNNVATWCVSFLQTIFKFKVNVILFVFVMATWQHHVTPKLHTFAACYSSFCGISPYYNSHFIIIFCIYCNNNRLNNFKLSINKNLLLATLDNKWDEIWPKRTKFWICKICKTGHPGRPLSFCKSERW